MTDADALLKGTQGRNGAGKFMQILLYAACSKGGCFGLRCVQEPSTWWTAKVHAGQTTCFGPEGVLEAYWMTAKSKAETLSETPRVFSSSRYWV